MNIKSLLIGSAAALAAVSGAQAADAIVAAEPEPLEYVRVCDAFGAGFFYIPGTETCLRVGGYVRAELGFDSERTNLRGGNNRLNTLARGHVFFDARNDTEFGTLQSYIAIQANAVNNDNTQVEVDEAYIDIAGLRVGYFMNWWDEGFNGETDSIGFLTEGTAARYWYDGGQFGAGIAVEELDIYRGRDTDYVGISGKIQAAFGPATFDVIGSYDTSYEDGAVQARISAEVGPGTLQAGIAYFSGFSNYSGAIGGEYEWTAFIGYEAKVTDRFTITPAFQYAWDGVSVRGLNEDDWKVGVTAGYQITEGLSTLATINYQDRPDSITGFLRLQRDF